ncbi:hypothetical protein [Thalassomonas haliotis]|uniref:Uncharacterized protein n=1 Tax=Thalassomonas haliotis TaxID=485448 RepID=A0ABY7VFY7_9GAMM|nr:hypothetical protein [Thalassomonas haliotis]WDE11828.1 hypothetical protein H3N35_27175 [Thalassomonas haliotis]
MTQVKSEGENLPGWHKQMSVYYQGINNPELARLHQQQALKLSRQYQPGSGEVWALK